MQSVQSFLCLFNGPASGLWEPHLLFGGQSERRGGVLTTNLWLPYCGMSHTLHTLGCSFGMCIMVCV